MSTFSEHRLLYRNLSDYGQTKLSTRRQQVTTRPKRQTFVNPAKKGSPNFGQNPGQSTMLPSERPKYKNWVNPNWKEVQDGLQVNFNYDRATPEERAEQERLTGLAMKPDQRNIDVRNKIKMKMDRDKLAGMSKKERAKQGGLYENYYDALDYMNKTGIKASGETNGLRRINLSEDQLRELEKYGAVNSSQRNSDGTYVALLNWGSQEENDMKSKYDFYSTDEDIKQADADIAASQTEDEALTGYLDGTDGEQVTDETEDDQATGTGEEGGGGLPASMQAAFSSLSPEEQAILGPIMQNLQSTFEGGMSDNAARTRAMLEGGMVDGVEVAGINNVYAQMQQQIDEMKSDREMMRTTLDDIAKDTRDENRALIEEEEAAAEARLTWQKDRDERELQKKKTKNHESMIAQYALSGGFAQDAALTDVREADAEFDQMLQDLQTEYGVQRTELSAKFTSLYVQNNNAYRDASVKNAENYLNSLERLVSQGQQNTTSFLTAQTNLLNTMWTNETNLRKEKAEGIRFITTEMLNSVQQERQAKAKAAQDAEKEMSQAAKEQASLSKEERSRLDAARKEKQKTISGVTDDLQSREWYKAFRESSNSFKSAFSFYDLFQEGKVDENAMQEAVTVLYEKMLDPTSVVREGEFERAAKGLGIKGVWQKVTDAINGGRGFPPSLVPSFMQIAESAYEERATQARNEAMPLLRRVKDFNTDYSEFGVRIDPTTIFPSDVLPLSDAAKSAGDALDDPQASNSSFIYDLALAHQEHEGYGSAAARTITKNNNPGALRWHPAQKQFGGVNDGSGFTKFPDYHSGFAALMSDISAKLHGKSSHIDYSSNPTLLDYISVYAPAADNNDPNSYANALVAALQAKGYDVDIYTPLSVLTQIA